MGFFRWLWGRVSAWPREAWCGRFHSWEYWQVTALHGGEAEVVCLRCRRHWVQLVGGSA